MSKFVNFCSALSVVDIAHMIDDLNKLDREGVLPQKGIFRAHVESCEGQCDLSRSDAFASLRAYVIGFGATQWAKSVLAKERIKMFVPGGVTAIFYPQVWNNDYAEPAGDPVEFDITADILKMSASEISKLRDDQDESDELADLDALGHSGPFRVECEFSICRFFDVDELEDITEDMVAKKREELL